MKTSNVSLDDATVIRITAFLIALATFIVYLPALNNGFVNWDDGLYVYENIYIRSINFKLLYWTKEVVIWHPVTMLSLAMDYAIWGLNPFGYHLTNNLIHAFNTSLIFILVIKLFKHNGLNEPGLNKRPFITASVTSILFGIHPFHVESVAWVSERKDVLCAFFYLLSLIAYLEYTSTDRKRKKPFYYSLCFTLFALALLSKPMAVSLPVVLLILDYYPLRRLTSENGLRKTTWVLIEKLPLFLLSLLLSLTTIWIHRSIGALRSADIPFFIDRIVVAVWAYTFYLIKMILPTNLAPLYPYPEQIDFLTFRYIASFIFWMIITFFAVKSMKRNSLFAATWFYYLITLLPVIGILKVGKYAVADHFSYLPSLGPFLLIGLGISVVFEKRYRFAIGSSLILIVALLSYKTVKQIAVWHDSMTLWAYEIKLYPNTQLAHNNRGIVHLGLNDYRQAIISFDKAIKLDPKYPEPYLNRSIAYFKLGNYQQAIKNLDIAIELNPRFAEAYYNRGLVFSELENYEQARIAFNKAIELNPGYVGAYYNRGIIYRKLRNYQQAIENYNKAIELDPLDSKVYYNRGNTNSRLGNYRDAIKDYSRAIGINPRYANAYNNRGLALASLGNYRQAIEDYNRVVEFDSQDVDAYYNRGIAFKETRAYRQAIDDFNTAIKLNPDGAAVHYNLGVVYSLLDNSPQSLVHYKEAAALGLKQAQDYLRNQGIPW